MSVAPEVKHFWSSGMTREKAQNYLLDLCGSESQNYTETEAEVTCERCLASLRAGSLPPRVEAPAGAPGPLDASGAPVSYVPDAVADQVRAAVLKEREEIIATAKMIMVTAYPMFEQSQHREPFRKLVDEIRRRP